MWLFARKCIKLVLNIKLLLPINWVENAVNKVRTQLTWKKKSFMRIPLCCVRPRTMSDETLRSMLLYATNPTITNSRWKMKADNVAWDIDNNHYWLSRSPANRRQKLNFVNFYHLLLFMCGYIVVINLLQQIFFLS